MAVLTPTSLSVMSNGNKIAITGTFTSVGNADTWAPGLSTIEAAQIEPGVSGVSHGATYSGGTVTVAASGAMANTKIMVWGT